MVSGDNSEESEVDSEDERKKARERAKERAKEKAKEAAMAKAKSVRTKGEGGGLCSAASSSINLSCSGVAL